MSEPLISKIVKIGSNERGDYIKFENGALIQYGTNTGVDNGYREFLYPIEFANIPKVLSTIKVFDDNYVHFTQVYNVSKTKCRVVVRYASSAGGSWGKGSNSFDWIAIGKWK